MENKIGARLRQFRMQASLKQEELADKIGVAKKTLQRWEYGETSPKASDMTRLCQVLGISEGELLHGPKEEDEWKLTIRMEATQMLDLSGSTCISDIELTQNGAALRLGGSYSVFENDEKFEDFIRQLRSARDLVIESGRKMRNIENKAEG